MPKKNIKILRDENKAKQLEEIKKNEEKRLKEEFERKYSDKSEKNESEKNKSEKKSTAKKAGLKSLYCINDKEQLMTSFGIGNEAIIEKKIDAYGKVDSIAEEKSFDAYITESNKQFVIKGRDRGEIDNPLSNTKRSVGQDMLHAKSALETLYFGETKPDNIHIQLIYNILDIKKILAVHTNNIVYAIDNIRRSSDSADIIGMGYFDLSKSYEDFINEKKGVKFFQELIALEQLSYYGNAFYRKTTEEESKSFKESFPDDEAPEYCLRDERDIYYILAMINELRQVCVHFTETGYAADGKNRRYSNIYNFDLTDEEKHILDTLYEEKIESLESFEENNSKCNFRILFDSLDIKADALKKQVVKDFYNFTIRKKGKNCGFSIKCLREMVIDLYDDDIKSKDYDSVRQKLNLIIDFIIYNYYMKNDEAKDNLILQLRTSEKNKEKMFIYYKEANYILPKIETSISHLLDAINELKQERIKPIDNSEKAIINSAIKEVALSKDVSYFSKLIYLITLFLDGKEINDLLTTLISKLDNIASIEAVLTKEFDCEIKFSEEFNLFDSDKFIKKVEDKKTKSYVCFIVDELADINGFARMSVPVVINKSVYKEAAYLLGTDLSEEDLDEYLKNNILNAKSENEKTCTSDCNFIFNNIVKSRSFKYLARYTDPKKIRPVAENKAIVRYVLSRITDAQINRYYASCGQKDDAPLSDKIEYLTNLISGMKPDYAMGINKKDPDKQLKRTVISLYLNVLYQVAKNLVYVNSRYIIAFHSLQRDYSLYGLKYDTDDDNDTAKIKKREGKYFDLVNSFIERQYINKRYTEYLKINKENSDAWSVTQYRNQIAHLTAIRNAGKYVEGIREVSSYFELYHCIMQLAIADYYHYCEKQKYIYEETDDNNQEKLINRYTNTKSEKREKIEREMNFKTKEYVDAVEKYNSYVKDFVKALNSPFGYNLPRFKNLSIDALFDKNDKREKLKKGFED